MSRETAVKRLLFLTLGILASPVQAGPIKLTNVQMDNVTAGAFIVWMDPNTLIYNPHILIGFNGQNPITLQSSDNGFTYVSSDGITWNNPLLLVSTRLGYAEGVLVGPQGQQWDGGYPFPHLTPALVDIVIIPQPGAATAKPPGPPLRIR
jgi:hypothetical protein